MHVHYVYAHTYIYTDTYKMFLKYYNHMDVSDYNKCVSFNENMHRYTDQRKYVVPLCLQQRALY